MEMMQNGPQGMPGDGAAHRDDEPEMMQHAGHASQRMEMQNGRRACPPMGPGAAG